MARAAASTESRFRLRGAGGLTAASTARVELDVGLAPGSAGRAPLAGLGLFVTGTDTAVGKTVLTAAIVAALRARGHAAKALKPVITGLEERPDRNWPHDHEVLGRAAGMPPEEVNTCGYGPAVSPHLAAELAGRPIEPGTLRDAVRNGSPQARPSAIVVEGVGGLLVPLNGSYDVRALASDLGFPLVVAARPGLGTINHTLLTLHAARSAGLEVAAIVLTPWPRSPNLMERSNLETISELGEVSVTTLPRIERADPELLAAAGEKLPLNHWFSFSPSLPSRRWADSGS